MPRVIASVEARMGSSRLPGKVLVDICGKPALTRVLNRLKSCESLDGIVLATSLNPIDNQVVKWANSEGVECHRGSENDVLLRVFEAHKKMNSEVIVEICGDMLLLDPEIIDLGVKTFLENECNFLTTNCKQSFPIGIDVVIFSLKDLEWVEKNISDSEVREHVSLYFVRHPEKYRTIHLLAPKRFHYPDYRFVLDYQEDLEFIRAVYEKLEPKVGACFGLEKIIELLKKEPDLIKINKHCEEKFII